MDAITNFLSANPLIALALAILAIILVLSVLKKLFKLALIIGIILLLSGGTVYHFAKEQVDTRGRELLQQGKQLLREGAETVEKRFAAELQPETSKDSTLQSDIRHTPKKAPARRAPKRPHDQ